MLDNTATKEFDKTIPYSINAYDARFFIVLMLFFIFKSITLFVSHFTLVSLT